MDSKKIPKGLRLTLNEETFGYFSNIKLGLLDYSSPDSAAPGRPISFLKNIPSKETASIPL